MVSELRNWAGNVAFQATLFSRPRSIAELQELVARARRLHVVGAGHSFTAIADSSEVLVRLDAMPPVLELDRDRRRVKVNAGMRLAELGPAIEAAGFALANLPSPPQVTIAGVCATGTHGSGDRIASMSSLVAALELVSPAGELISLEREAHPEELAGSVVACGALGPVVTVTLDVLESFRLRQDVYDDLAFDEVLSHLDELLGGAYSVSLYLEWSTPRVHQMWRRVRLDAGASAPPNEIHGARRADGQRHPMPGLDPRGCTEQMVPGPWHARLPLFSADVEPASAGGELQTEYLLPRQHAVEALARLRRRRGEFAHLVMSGEVRSVAPDEMWLSPAYRQHSVAIHWTWVNDQQAVLAALPGIEAELAPLGARPHWGKLFTMAPAEVTARYERFGDFEKLLARRDPEHKFANDFSDTYLGTAP